MFLGVSWNQYQFNTSIQQVPENLIASFSSVYTYPCKMFYVPLGKDGRKANINLFGKVRFSKVLLLSFIKRTQVT